MIKKLVLIAVVLTTLLATAGPALAARGYFYVDTNYNGTETGTMAQPFKTYDKAIAAARANPDGGYIYTGTAGTNNWTYTAFIRGVNPPPSGALLSRTALFVLLGLASLILVAAGWYLMRRTRALPSRV